MSASKTFRREVWANPRLVISTCVYCADKAASGDLRLLLLVETLHECHKLTAEFEQHMGDKHFTKRQAA